MGLLRRDITISRNLFGSTYFTLTGFHGIHVTLGLLMLLTLFAAGNDGQAGTPRNVRSLRAVSYYWHFVDLVWVDGVQAWSTSGRPDDPRK